MIEGVSSNWSPWQKGGEISFLQLPEGKYVLKIRKYVVKGPYLEIAIPITVRPAWYNTIWAWLIYIIAIAVIGKYTQLPSEKPATGRKKQAGCKKAGGRTENPADEKPDAGSRAAKQE